ncbi:MAG: hypothetical protein HC880_13860 [Bacteroidia bacterium]|nr:hypothetical protein [Bacteroidia bacterium]
MKKDLSEEEYKKAKQEILSQSKNKGLDLWERVLQHYDYEVEKAKATGLYMPELGGYMILYFDKEQDQWLMRPADPKES